MNTRVIAAWKRLQPAVENEEGSGSLKDLHCFGGPSESSKLMGSMTMLRSPRILEVSIVEFSATSDQLTWLLGCDLQTASDVFVRLLSEKVVITSDGSRTKSLKKTKGSRYHIAPEHSEMMEKFFNPLYNIEDYVSRIGYMI